MAMTDKIVLFDTLPKEERERLTNAMKQYYPLGGLISQPLSDEDDQEILIVISAKKPIPISQEPGLRVTLNAIGNCLNQLYEDSINAKKTLQI